MGFPTKASSYYEVDISPAGDWQVDLYTKTGELVGTVASGLEQHVEVAEVQARAAIKKDKLVLQKAVALAAYNNDVNALQVETDHAAADALAGLNRSFTVKA